MTPAWLPWALIHRPKKATKAKKPAAKKKAAAKPAAKKPAAKHPAPRSGAVAKPKKAGSPRPATVAA